MEEEEASDVTEEQRIRAETNRLAALAKRRAVADSGVDPQPWRLFKCRKLSVVAADKALPSTGTLNSPGCVPEIPSPEPQLTEKFLVRLEICSPDSFSATPEPVKGFAFPGDEECLRRLGDYLANVMPTHYTQSLAGGKVGIYKLRDYDVVVRCLKSVKSVDYEEIPWGTYNVIEKLSHSYVEGRWIPCRPEHFPSDTVDELMRMLLKKIRDAPMPFQMDGVRFGLQRGGRCLIADEMGLGKTLQAVAIASCFMNEGSTLVVCPAILRFSWAEESERECMLENMRTLCVACHSDVTAAQCADRRAERVKARKQLKKILKDLKNDENSGVPETKPKAPTDAEAEENAAEEELFADVPGSAYSTFPRRPR